jgi:hypothetical protein
MEAERNMREITMTSHLADMVRLNEKRSRRALYFLGVSLLLAVAGFFAANMGILVILGIGGAMGGFVRFMAVEKIIEPYRQGLIGELTFRIKLKELLSDDHTAFYGYPLKRGGDLDCLVLGPTGLYALEVKHHNGTIQYTEGGWSQVKVGQGGTAYRGKLKNPSGQMMSGLHEVKELLAAKGVRVFIQGVVVFTNPDLQLSIEKSPRTFKAYRVEELAGLFQARGRGLTSSDREKIERALLEGRRAASSPTARQEAEAA